MAGVYMAVNRMTIRVAAQDDHFLMCFPGGRAIVTLLLTSIAKEWAGMLPLCLLSLSHSSCMFMDCSEAMLS